jgi:hypothetical protein
MTLTEHLRPKLGRELPAALLAFAGLLCPAAQAADQPAPRAAPECPLTVMATLPLATLSNGQPSVTANIGGKEEAFTLGLSDPYSYLYGSYIKARGFTLKDMPKGAVIRMGQKQSSAVAVVPEFTIGTASGKNLQFAQFDDPAKSSGDVGELALDILSHFDLDFDLANSTLKLISQDHCAGKVVYWADTFAPVPFITDPTGHPSFRMLLDGKALTVAFAIMPRPAFMAMATVKRLWGMDATASGMTPTATDAKGAPTTYRYPFRQLAIEGVAIANPQIDLLANGTDCHPRPDPSPYVMPMGQQRASCYGASELELGLNEMRQLHLYFAFKEKMLYVTAASADGTKPPSSEGAPPASLGKPK